MSILKKFAAPLTAVALVAVMGVSLIASPRTASAATAVTVRADLNSVTTAAAGTAFTFTFSIDATEQDGAGSTLVVTAPGGFAFVGVPTVTETGPTLVYGAGAVTAATATVNTFVTFTATTLNSSAGSATVTVSGFIRNAGPGAGAGAAGGSAGVLSVGGVDMTAIADVGALNTAYVSPFTVAIVTVPAGVASVAADGSQQITINATLTDASGVLAANRAVAWTTSIGYLSTGTSKSANSFSTNAGVASQSYRGAGGIATTDTIIAAHSPGNVVGTLSMALTSPSGNTAAKLVVLAPNVLAIAPQTTNVSPGYSSPTNGSNVAVQAQDASGLGVNGQVLLLSVDKGSIVANAAFAGVANTICTGVTANSITQTTAGTNLNAPGGTATAGYVNFAVCADQNDPLGQITVTAQNVSTSMANATTTLSHAGRPNKITATVNGNQINVKVTDAKDNNVADGTPIRFTMSANAGAVSVACTTSTNGAASAVVALVTAGGTVIVSSDYNETGTLATASTCAVAGSQQVATSAQIGAGGPGPGPAPAPTAGAGTFASAPVYSASKLAQSVFNGGTVAQLEAAVTAAKGTGVWAQDKNGVFVLYIVNGGFVNDGFKAAFPTGFSGVIAVTVVGQ